MHLPPPPAPPSDHVDVAVLQDADLPLHRWRDIIADLISMYGPDATMALDGGHNNVSCIVTKRTLHPKD